MHSLKIINDIIQSVRQASHQISKGDVFSLRELIRILDRATSNISQFPELARENVLDVLDMYSNWFSTKSDSLQTRGLTYEQLKACVSNGIHVIANMLNVKNNSDNQSRIMVHSSKNRAILQLMSNSIFSKKLQVNSNYVFFARECT